MNKPKQPIVEFALLPSYLAFIRNGVGSRMFQSVYCRVDGRLTDVTDHGRISCGLHVSSLLKIFGLVGSQHATITGTVRDMEASGWKRIARPRLGAVILWEPQDHGGTVNHHLGFMVAKGLAVSNSTSRAEIAEHDLTYGMVNGRPARRIEACYWHERLAKR